MAAVLVSFILLFYVPTLLFRFTATYFVDLGRRKNLNQIEDFFAAALPSVALNITAWILLNTLTLWWLAEETVALPLLLTSDAIAVLRQHLVLVCGYYAFLLAISASLGLLYGWKVRQIVLLGEELERYLGGELSTWAFWLYRFWDIFFHSETVSQFPWVVQQTYVYARTSDRLYYGLVESYDRGSDGEIAGLTLVRTHRFSLKTREECLESDLPYVRRLNGSFYLKWSTITDINLADVDQPKTMVKVLLEYRRDRQRQRQRQQADESGPWT